MVVTGHVLEALSPIVLAPAQSFHGSFLFMQLPFVRLLHSGRVSVAAFALIAGLVNALKPIRLMQLGERNKALSSIALSAFRRTGRLVLPTSVATIIAFFLTQIGSFEVAKHANQQWIRNISPARPKSFSQAFNSLLRNLITTWTKGDNDYDKIQWTITFFLQAAMWTYMILVATAHVTSKGRLLVYSGLYCYFWYAKNRQYHYVDQTIRFSCGDAD